MLIEAEGNYFDEIKGKTTKESIKLSTIIDLQKDDLIANINILTTIQAGKLPYFIELGNDFC